MKAALGLFVLAAFTACSPGGVRPSYSAKDHDPLLTKIARSAAPTRTAVTRFHDSYSRYPATDEELRTFMAKPQSAWVDDAAPGWHYSRKPDGSGFSLSHGLGWDPTLLYEFDGSRGQWIFDPGDGSDRKAVLLQP